MSVVAEGPRDALCQLTMSVKLSVIVASTHAA